MPGVSGRLQPKELLDAGPTFNSYGSIAGGGLYFDPQDRLWVSGYRTMEGTSDAEPGTMGVWVSPSLPMD